MGQCAVFLQPGKELLKLMRMKDVSLGYKKGYNKLDLLI